MDQIKIGKFIAACRKEQHLTQMQLAEKLNITDRAVSKWETGNTMPDSSIMLELCDILGIGVNDLLSGERVTMDKYNKQLETNLLNMVKEKEQADKRLLSLEIFIGVLVSIILFALIGVASFAPIADGWRVALIGIGTVPFIVGVLIALRIEQTAGYYECRACGHRYVPQYSSVAMAMHVNRTRYMRCPHCGKRSWQKKVLNRE